MTSSAIFSCASEALAAPKIVPVKDGLYAISLDVMKIIPARYILRKAWQERAIGKDSLIVESSSGNLALGLAIVAREMELRLHIVGDPAIDPHLRNMLQNLGARVDIIAEPDATGSYQRPRLARTAEIIRANPGAFWVRQYDNRDNAAAYGDIAARIHQALGNRLHLVAGVGSGGSSVGLGRALRSRGADLSLTGVDTFNSVLFGLPDGKRALRGLGNSVMPGILDHSQFDDVHWVSNRLANRSAVALHARHGLFHGPTSGAAFRVASHLAATAPRGVVAFLAPDTGYRYQSTVFSGECDDGHEPNLPETPLQVGAPAQVNLHADWTCMHWGRRSLAEVQGMPAAQLEGSI